MKLPDRLEELLALRTQLDAQITAEIRRLAANGQASGIPPAEILYRVAALYSLDVEDLTGTSRAPRHVTARQVAAYTMRQAGHSFPVIGRALRRDHTTAMYAVRRVERTPPLRAVARTLLAETEAA